MEGLMERFPVFLPFRVFHIRQHSLVRGVMLAIGSFTASLLAAGFPYVERLHGSPWQWAALLGGLWGLAETVRCIQKRWSLYHAGVLILIYTELMVLTMIVFLAVYL